MTADLEMIKGSCMRFILKLFLEDDKNRVSLKKGGPFTYKFQGQPVAVTLSAPDDAWANNFRNCELESLVRDEKVVLNVRTMTVHKMTGNITTAIIVTLAMTRGEDDRELFVSSYPTVLYQVLQRLRSPELGSHVFEGVRSCAHTFGTVHLCC